jgi:site-specific recombinase XerC
LNISPPLKASLLKHGAAAHSSTFKLAKELSMTSLRQRFIEDMQIRNLAVNTQESYVLQVSLFARHFQKSPELLGPEQIRAYQVYLTNEKKLSTGSIIVAISALRFLYRVTLKKDWSFRDLIPVPKVPKKLPIILSPEEVVQFLDCVRTRKHRAILTTCYAAGLRISDPKPSRSHPRRSTASVWSCGSSRAKDRKTAYGPRRIMQRIFSSAAWRQQA